MKNLLAAMLAITLSINTSAESYESKQHHEQSINGETNGFGVFGTVYWTWGFGYRRHFSNRLGVSANLGPWFDGTNAYVGSGIGLLYSFANYKFNKSFLPDSSIRVLGAIYVSPRYERSTRYETTDGDRKRVGVNTFYLGFGAGPGVEYFFNRHFAVHLEVPWMTFFEFKRGSAGFANSYPNVGGGFVYYF